MNKQQIRHPDYRLFNLFCKKDRETNNNIYKDFFPKIKQMVRTNHGSTDDAWDIFQEGLIALVKYCSKENFVLKVPLFYFLYPICKRLWLKELEKKGKSGVTFSDLTEYKNTKNVITQREDEILHTHRLQVLWKHLEHLPEREQQTLKLYYIEGKSHREIAEIVGFSNEASAKVQKFKYIRRLRALVLRDRDFE